MSTVPHVRPPAAGDVAPPVATAAAAPPPAPAPDAAHLARLHDRLVTDATTAGVLDIAYRTVDSPVGVLLLAATPAGLLRVAFAGEGHDRVLTELAAAVSPRVLRAPARLDAVARELEEYFAGRRHAFDLPLDLRLAHGFRRAVLDRLAEVPYGATTTYARLAAATGSPRAVRAVGTACARNPLPVVVPCHRAVRSDGTVGRYLGGTGAKLALLALEGTAGTVPG